MTLLVYQRCLTVLSCILLGLGLGCCLPLPLLAQTHPALSGFSLTAPPHPLPGQIIIHAADGKAVRLQDFSGRPVLINFWATWCVPCVAEMPSLDALQARPPTPDLVVLAVSLDRTGRKAVAPFFQRLSLHTLTPYYDPRGRLAKAVDVQGLPTSLLVDRQGREVARFLGPVDWFLPVVQTLFQQYLK